MVPILFLIITAFSLSANALTIVGTSNRAGELEPCGCQVNQVGGINRMAEWVSTQRKFTEVLVLDAGDTFFSSPELAETRKPMEKLRALTIADSYKEIGVQVMTPGERDLALGLGFLSELGKRSGLKFVVTNVKEGLGDGYLRTELVKTKEALVGVIGLVSDAVFETTVKTEEPFETLEWALKDLKEKGVTKLVVLSHLGLEKDKEIIEKFKDLIVIGAHSLDPVVFTSEKTKSVVFQPQHEGQQMGVSVDGLTKLLDLSSDWDKQNSVSKIVRHYHEVRGISKANERVTPVLATAEKPFVADPQKCKACHEAQYLFWENTKHSSSILALYAKRQHLNPDCISCHSLGFGQPGGFSSPGEAIRFKKKKKAASKFLEEVFVGDGGGSLDSRKDPDRYQKLHLKYHEKVKEDLKGERLKRIYWGTQCEHCHGNRAGHPQSGTTQKKVTAETCVQCHRPPNAPEFDLGMIAKVACPLMKK